MSMARSPGGIDEKDHYYFKVYKVLASEARDVLHFILCKGCPKDSNISFENYAKGQLGMKKEKFEINFDSTMRSRMSSNISGDEFDVSLLYACIKSLCSSMKSKDKMKYIKPIKDFRNNLVHNISEVKNESEMNKLIQKLQKLLVAALKRAKDIYPDKISNDKFEYKIKQLDKNIKDIIECTMSVSDINVYRTQVKELREAMKTLIRDSGIKQLKETFKSLSNVDPASWLTGKDRLDVKMVYTRLDIFAKTKGNPDYSVSHEKLLELKTEEGETPTVTVVEGEAGSGKSTLAKYILKNYADIDDCNPCLNIRGLEEYELVLYVECRNKSIGNFVDLLLTSMPQVSYEMTDYDFVHAVLDMKTLVVVDGLDEMRDGSNSESLLREIFEKYVKMSNGKLRFIMTTRPRKMDSPVYRNYPSIHARLKGIPQERRVDFVRKLHDVMIEKGISKQSTSNLVDYVKQSQSRLGEHYRLPLNLTLLTYLWAEDPKSMNSVTSATNLYVALLKLLKLRLMSRIKDDIGSTEGLEEKVEDFVKVVFEVYLKTHLSGETMIAEGGVNELKDKCNKLELRFDDMVGSFFKVETEWNTYGTTVHLKAPHNSIMEFFSAFQIFTRMTADENQQTLTDKLKEVEIEFKQQSKNTEAFKNLYLELDSKKSNKSLEAVLKTLLGDFDNIDFADHHNVLLHLGGLMALQNRDCLHENGSKLVDFLDRGGITADQWLDLVAEAECDPTLTALVAQQISNKLVIRDGHTLAALQIFENLETNLPVQVILECEVRYIPEIDLFIDKLSERDCDVELLLKNHWKNPSLGNSTMHLQKLYTNTSTVTRFTGNLDDLKVLPEEVDNLRLTIANDDQAKTICGSFHKLELDYLGIHVQKEVSPALLKPMPVIKPKDKQSGTLWISNVGCDDMDKACNIAVALLPQGMKFNSIAFPRCSLSKERFKELLQKLNEKGVRVSEKGGVKTDSENLDNVSVIDLRRFARDTLHCEFHWGDEESVW